MKHSDEKKMSRRVVLQATTILILLALVLVVIGYIYLHFAGDYKINDLVLDIVSNLIGVLAAFLLFDIVYNQLTQDAYAREASQQIAKTLMGNSDALDAFGDEDKKAFLASTIKSIVKDEDAIDMMLGNIGKYIDCDKLARIRKSFNYAITLTTEFPAIYEGFPGIESDKYFYVQENLNYEVKYLGGQDVNLSSEKVKIGFHFNKRDLDVGLLGGEKDLEFSKCVFNENLDITEDAIEYLRNMKNEELAETFQKLFTVVLKVDGVQGEFKNVEVRDGGMVATYNINYHMEKDEHLIKIIFHMPKLWDSIFEVTLVDPTKNPQITFDYIPGKMDVTMYSYLNKEDGSNNGAYEQQNGLYDVAIKDEWIYPKSGIVFNVKKKERSV